MDYEWADRRQEERAGIFFDRKEEGKREEEKEINQEKRITGVGERKKGAQKRSDRKIIRMTGKLSG